MQAVDVLTQCRTTVMYSYPFAFQMKNNNQLLIFEANQHDLEVAVEELSEYLDRGMNSEEPLADIKMKVRFDRLLG